MDKTILICGIDGYIGWNLAMYLSRKNYKVIGIDNFSRRNQVAEVGSDSLTPIQDINTRLKEFKETFGKEIEFICGNMKNYHFIKNVLKKYKPQVIINLAQMPSAPYSMISAEKATWTTENNTISNLNLLWAVKGICPSTHLIKMGTMGEYGTPNIDITEGFFEIEYNGRKDVLPFPKQAGSFYHWSKVFDSQHTMFACNVWGLKSTDIMQGIVYGVTTDESKRNEKLLSRFDYDAIFGTLINRYVVQAMAGIPLTPYGTGGQIRGFINIKDALKCFELYIKNPPKKGEYRVFNQIAEQHRTVYELAELVVEVAEEFGYNPQIKRISNPRVEKEKHYYNVENSKLIDLGFRPSDLKSEIKQMFVDLQNYTNKVKYEVVKPKIKWNAGRKV